MTTYHVSYQAVASFVVTVDVDDTGLSEEEATELARDAADGARGDQAPSRLCHHCAGKYDLGDFEQGDGDDAVWKA